MTTEELQSLAAKIYVGLCAQAAQDTWDWQPIAARAFDAAEALSAIAEQRYASSPPLKPTPPKLQHQPQLQPSMLPSWLTGYGQQQS
jgi:hypothetical protein